MTAYCLDAAVLAGIVSATAAGTAVLFFIFCAVYLCINRRRDKAQYSQQDTAVIDKKDNNAEAGTCKNDSRMLTTSEMHCAVYDNSRFENDDKASKVGQSTLSGGSNDCDGFVTIIKKEKNRKVTANGNAKRNTMRENGYISHRSDTMVRPHKLQIDFDHESKSIQCLAVEDNSPGPISTIRLAAGELIPDALQLRKEFDCLFIEAIRENYVTDKSCRLHPGERLLSVKIDFSKLSLENATAILQLASNSAVTLETERAKCPTGEMSIGGQNTISATCKNSRRIIPHKSVSLETIKSGRDSNQLCKSGQLRHAHSSSSSHYKSLDCFPLSKSDKLDLMDLCSPIPKDPATVLTAFDQQSKPLVNGYHESFSTGVRDWEIPNDNKLTVIAEINLLPNGDAKIDTPASVDRNESIKNIDPYAGLSATDRMQLIRLSYEEPDLSISTPNLSINSQAPTADSAYALTEKESVTQKCNGTSENHVPTTAASPVSKIPVSKAARRRRASVLSDLDQMETASTTSAASSVKAPILKPNNIQNGKKPEPKQLVPRFCRPMKAPRETQNGSPATGPTEDWGEAIPPRDSKKSSGYVSEELEKEQFEKLMYFQKQLERQQEELTRLGVHAPAFETQKVPNKKLANGHI